MSGSCEWGRLRLQLTRGRHTKALGSVQHHTPFLARHFLSFFFISFLKHSEHHILMLDNPNTFIGNCANAYAWISLSCSAVKCSPTETYLCQPLCKWMFYLQEEELGKLLSLCPVLSLYVVVLNNGRRKFHVLVIYLAHIHDVCISVYICVCIRDIGTSRPTWGLGAPCSSLSF